MKKQLKSYWHGNSATKFVTDKPCTCCACKRDIPIGATAIWESSMGQDDVWCTNCAEVV